MPQLLPIKVVSSKLLSILYTYARSIELYAQELQRTKDDNNIPTCRAEYIQAIWGNKFGQVFTSDFDIDTYRQLMLDLVDISLTDSDSANILKTIHAYFPDADVEILEYWKDPSLLIGYNWQNTSFQMRGVGVSPISGNNFNDTMSIIPDLSILGFFLFGVQIHVRNITAEQSAKIDLYVVPALETFVRPAGIYYKAIVLDIDLTPLERVKAESTRETAVISSILGFGLTPFGSPAPAPPNDWGFGAPSFS